VFLVVVDTLRADHLSAYGYPEPTSPTLDRLAREGVLLEDVTAQCSWTKPSVVSLMTSHYITTYRDTFEESATTMAESFRDAGYRTIGVVGNVLLSKAEGFDRGFDHYDARRVSGEVAEKPGPCRTLDELLEDLWGPLDAALGDGAGAERQPLFVCFHIMEPHNPYVYRKPLREVLKKRNSPEFDPDGWLAASYAAGGDEPPEEDAGWENAWGRIRSLRYHYDHEIRYTDAGLQRLMDGLLQRGLLANAVLGVVADHGESLWEHAALPKTKGEDATAPFDYFHQEHGVFLYQGLIGTPMVLWGAGLPAGVRVPNAVENVDLYPTLLELADVAPPEGLHGRSVVPLINGAAWNKEFVHSYVLQHASIREVATGLKLQVPTEVGVSQGAQVSLYDLMEDPEEHDNLAAQRPAEVERLLGLLEKWREGYPMASSNEALKDQQTLDDLKALGYAGD
jgi:arylsulfatase